MIENLIPIIRDKKKQTNKIIININPMILKCIYSLIEYSAENLNFIFGCFSSLTTTLLRFIFKILENQK